MLLKVWTLRNLATLGGHLDAWATWDISRAVDSVTELGDLALSRNTRQGLELMGFGAYVLVRLWGLQSFLCGGSSFLKADGGP